MSLSPPAVAPPLSVNFRSSSTMPSIGPTIPPSSSTASTSGLALAFWVKNHSGSAIPSLNDCGPSGCPYSLQFCRATGSVRVLYAFWIFIIFISAKATLSRLRSGDGSGSSSGKGKGSGSGNGTVRGWGQVFRFGVPGWYLRAILLKAFLTAASSARDESRLRMA